MSFVRSRELILHYKDQRVALLREMIAVSFKTQTQYKHTMLVKCEVFNVRTDSVCTYDFAIPCHIM
jgi:hypothetical protein